jgi:O-methyltransferase
MQMERSSMDRTARSLLNRTKMLLLRTPIKELFGHKYLYMFSPAQLGFLCEQVAKTASVPGSIVEVGCAFGATTVFLNRHLDSLGIQADYYAVDTFKGFTKGDILAENQLGRSYDYNTDFRHNSKGFFDRTMRRNGVTRVTSFRADATNFDYKDIAPFRFALVDVDLYSPVRAVLNSIYDLMSPGGIIVVDDCQVGGRWSGAYDAFTEFAAAAHLEPIIVHDKLGLIVKPESQ